MGPVLFAFVLVSFCALLIKYFADKRKSDAIAIHFPTPPRMPLIGVTMFTKTGLINAYEMFHTAMSFPRKYGQNVILHGFFNYIDILMTRPEDLESILTGKTTKKSYFYDYITAWLGDSLLISTGAKWHSRRKLITGTFHFKNLLDFLDVFNEQNRKFIQKLEKHVEGSDFNMYEYITSLALDNICETAMGVQINAQDNSNSGYIEAVKTMGDLIVNRVFSIPNQVPLLWHLTLDAWRTRRVLKVLHAFTDSVIKLRRAQINTQKSTEITIHDHKKRLSFLDMLLQANINGEPLSDIDIREEVDTFMFAGHDTTTVAMCFIVYNLAMHPDIQEKAFDEIQRVLGDDVSTPSTASNLQEMKYLEMIIKETLRLYPPATIIGRKTLEPIQIQGVTVPAGFNINIPIYAIHRNPQIFPDPEKFDPERFEEEKERSWGPFDYIPFSAGTRNCIGQKFAMLEMKSTISALLRNFKVVATDRTRSMKYQCDLVIRPIDGLYVKLERR